MQSPRRHLPILLVALFFALLPALSRAADRTLVIHYPDGGAPPWLFLAPGGSEPVGVVAELLETVARQSNRQLRYAFQPRESSNDSLRNGSAHGAIYFSATRPPARDLLVTDTLLGMDSVLVTRRESPIHYQRPSDLRDQRLCTLTEEIYPPLTLLAMNGNLLQRKAKTEQAQLMMLRNEDCVAAIVNGPMYGWLAAKYRWDDLRIETRPLLSEQLLLGFAPGEEKLVGEINRTIRKLRDSGELSAWVSRYLPGKGYVTLR